MSGPADRDEFYVGYHPEAPPALARGVRAIVALLVLAVLGIGAFLGATQRPADAGVFEYGHLRTLRGRLVLKPYPMLFVPGTHLTDRRAAYTRYLLVGQGKHGADSLVRGLEGRWVELAGTRIARGQREMLEVATGGVRPAPAAPGSDAVLPGPPRPLGRMTLTGEVVDSKCWLGVMKPATRAVHRGCAARCLSGGIPPLLMMHDSAGHTVHLLLTGPAGESASSRFVPLVGRDVRLTGEVFDQGDLLWMRVEGVEEL